MQHSDLGEEERLILQSMFPLVQAKSPLLKRQLKGAMLIWYSCHYGIITKDNMPRFQGGGDRNKGLVDHDYILSTHFVSNDVLTLINDPAKYQPIRLEHIIPAKLVIDELQTRSINDVGLLREFLIENVLIGFITKREDDKLRKNKLTQTMPDGWDGSNPLDRCWHQRPPSARFQNWPTHICHE